MSLTAIENKLYNEVMGRIRNYREKKENNIFDDFFDCHLDFMSKCIDYYMMCRANEKDNLKYIKNNTLVKYFDDLNKDLHKNYLREDIDKNLMDFNSEYELIKYVELKDHRLVELIDNISGATEEEVIEAVERLSNLSNTF